jgi:hypothetical protein
MKVFRLFTAVDGSVSLGTMALALLTTETFNHSLQPFVHERGLNE